MITVTITMMETAQMAMQEKVSGMPSLKKVSKMKMAHNVMADMIWRLRTSTIGSKRPCPRERLAFRLSCDALSDMTSWVLPLWRGQLQILAWDSRRPFCLAIAGCAFFMLLWV